MMFFLNLLLLYSSCSPFSLFVIHRRSFFLFFIFLFVVLVILLFIAFFALTSMTLSIFSPKLNICNLSCSCCYSQLPFRPSDPQQLTSPLRIVSRDRLWWRHSWRRRYRRCGRCWTRRLRAHTSWSDDSEWQRLRRWRATSLSVCKPYARAARESRTRHVTTYCDGHVVSCCFSVI